MIVNRKQFIEVLSVVETAVSGISSVPLFTRVLVRYNPEGQGGLTVRGTDGSIFLEGRVACEDSPDEPFAIALPPDRLLTVLNTMRGDQVRLTSCPGKEGRMDLRLQAGKTDTVIAGLNGAEYPPMPAMTPLRSWQVNAGLLSEGIRACVHAAVNPQKAQVRGIMNTIAFFPWPESDPQDPEHPYDRLVIFASDTHRAARASLPMTDLMLHPNHFSNQEAERDLPPDVLLPLPEAQVLARMLTASPEGEPARLRQAGGGLTVETHNFRGVFSLVDGSWVKGLAWSEGLLADAMTFEGYCDREALLASIKGARACIPREGANEWQDDLIALITNNPVTGPELHVRTGDRDGARFSDALEFTLHRGELFSCPTSRFLAEALPVLSRPTLGIKVGERYPSLILADAEEPGENGNGLLVSLFIQPRTLDDAPLAVAIRKEWQAIKSG